MAHKMRGVEDTGQNPLVLKVRDNPKPWFSRALLKMGSPIGFEVEVFAEDSGRTGPNFLIGIAPHDADVNIGSDYRGFCAEYPDCVCLHVNSPYMSVLGKEQSAGNDPVKVLHAFKDKETLLMVYSDGLLTFTFAEQNIFAVKVNKLDYLPIVFLSSGSSALHVRDVSRKRKHAPEVVTGQLWKYRKFTDAEVRCGVEVFPVHKGVIAAGSPVIERMLESGMRESQEAVIRIEEASSEAVRAMLQFLYTSVPGDADVAELFSLAHRFDITDLADEVGEKLLTDVTPQNFKSRAKALLLHKHCPLAARLWQGLCKKLRESEEGLLEGILEELVFERCAS